MDFFFFKKDYHPRARGDNTDELGFNFSDKYAR